MQHTALGLSDPVASAASPSPSAFGGSSRQKRPGTFLSTFLSSGMPSRGLLVGAVGDHRARGERAGLAGICRASDAPPTPALVPPK